MIEKPINSPDYKTLPLKEGRLRVEETDKILAANISIKELEERLHDIPERERIILTLKFFTRITNRGIARIVERSERTVERSLEKLKEMLK